MVIKRIYIIFLGCLSFLISACTTTSNTYYNRQWQPVSTKYNVLFHSEEAFDKGKKELDEKYQDDFSEILPVEPTAMSEEIKLRGEENPNFERAEEKAIKTIQKHSMMFDGVQRNYKIDDAYMMLGKARYFNERFIPALEAFNHLLDTYNESNRLGDAAIWREKVNLRLGKDEIAIENLQNVIDTLKMSRNTEADARATLAQAYINLNQLELAVPELEKAAILTRNKNYKGRYYFISAQLHEKLLNKQNATKDYENVVKLNWKIPRRLWVEAQAGIARNKNFTKEEKDDFLRYLSRLENRYEHKDLLDVLYHCHAELLQKNGDLNGAIALYKKSLKENTQNDKLKVVTYKNTAEIYFENKKYLEAYNYYDSTLVFLPEKTLERLYLERKRDNLKEIASLENVVKKSDSLLRFENMSQKQKDLYFEKYKDSLQKRIVVNNNRGNFSLGVNYLPSQSQKVNDSDKFYFYNPVAVAYGKQNFRKLWGNRILKDNWRWQKLVVNEKLDSVSMISSADSILQEKEEKIINPLDFLPKTQEEWQLIKNNRNESLYKLGLLYGGKFKDYDLAIDKFEKLLASSPNQDLFIASNYELYKIYNQLGLGKSEVYKNRILLEYPNSDYAYILLGKSESVGEKVLSDLYNQASIDLENEEFENVVKIVNTINLKTQKGELVPKLAFLKAKALARLEGVQSYQDELKIIQKEYPQASISKEIDSILVDLQPLLLDKNFDNTNITSWKIVIRNIPKEELDEVYLLYQKELDSISSHLKVSKDLYDRKQTWLVIHNIQSMSVVSQIIKEIEKFLRKDEEFFVISSDNYRKVQIHKNIEDYLDKNN